MNKRVLAAVPQPGLQSGANYFGLIICGALFICGCVAGTAAAKLASGSGFSDYLSSYLPLSDGAAIRTPDFFSSLWSACKYHLAAIFLGSSFLGVLCLPALSAVRGFFLCFSISAVVRHFGGDGVFLALAIFGVSAIMTIPCFFVLTVQSFSVSLHLLRSVTTGGARGTMGLYGGSFIRRLIACFAVLVCSALADTLLISRLVAYIAAQVI